jgi:hypothetical protein
MARRTFRSSRGGFVTLSTFLLAALAGCQHDQKRDDAFPFLLVTGRSWLKSGTEMTVIGLGEALITYGIGLLIAPAMR